MKPWTLIAANILLFDALWTLAVFGAGTPWWWLAPLLIGCSAAVQLRWSPAPAAEALLILAGAAVGVTLDSVSASLGLFRYVSSSRTEFMIVFLALWANFGTTLRPSLRWIWRRPLVGALFGALGGPLAYWTASRIGAITPIEPAWRALAWCSAQYAAAVPLWCAAAASVLSEPRERAGPPSSNAPPRTPRTPPS